MNETTTSAEFFLLSKEQYSKYSGLIPDVNESWWLNGSTEDGTINAVSPDGTCNEEGIIPTEAAGVRPATFLIEWKAKVLAPGSTILNERGCWVLLDNKSGLAVSKTVIDMKVFDKEGKTDFEESDICYWLMKRSELMGEQAQPAAKSMFTKTMSFGSQLIKDFKSLM